MKIELDIYTLRARYMPALISLLPLGLLIIAIFKEWYWGLFWSVMTTSVGTILLSHFGRDPGKKKESGLFEAWGGKPSTRLLRHRCSENKTVLMRRHKKLESLIQDIKLPNPDEEEENPEKADEIYEACVSFLREKTRNKEIYNLVFEENCNYGFRRNLWGLKPFGVFLTVIGLLLVALLIANKLYSKSIPISPFMIIGGIGLLVFLIGWLFLVTKKWVRNVAETYAERLLATIDVL